MSATIALRLLEDRLAVEPINPPSITPGGIALPPNAIDKATRGRVVAIGPGRTFTGLGEDDRRAMTVQEGDVVLFQSYAGTETTIDGTDLRILFESDILAILN